MPFRKPAYIFGRFFAVVDASRGGREIADGYAVYIFLVLRLAG